MTTIAASAVPPNLAAHCRDIAARARRAAIDLAGVPGDRKAAALRAAAARIRADAAAILAANRLDVEAAPGVGLTPPSMALFSSITLLGWGQLGLTRAEVAAMPEPVLARLFRMTKADVMRSVK